MVIVARPGVCSISIWKDSSLEEMKGYTFHNKWSALLHKMERKFGNKGPSNWNMSKQQTMIAWKTAGSISG